MRCGVGTKQFQASPPARSGAEEVYADAIEEQIIELHHRKRDLADRILAWTDGPGRPSAEELLALLRQPLRAADRRTGMSGPEVAEVERDGVERG